MPENFSWTIRKSIRLRCRSVAYPCNHSAPLTSNLRWQMRACNEVIQQAIATHGPKRHPLRCSACEVRHGRSLVWEQRCWPRVPMRRHCTCGRRAVVRDRCAALPSRASCYFGEALAVSAWWAPGVVSKKHNDSRLLLVLDELWTGANCYWTSPQSSDVWHYFCLLTIGVQLTM